jgi:hypothetical protein
MSVICAGTYFREKNPTMQTLVCLSNEGELVGWHEGELDGWPVGSLVGASVGCAVGCPLGTFDGCEDG